ncbi:MAG: AAA family ATPase [Candidatus Hodarchaeota archaeon]
MVSVGKLSSNEITKDELLTLAQHSLDGSSLEFLGRLYSSVRSFIDRSYGSLYSLDWITIDGLKTFRRPVTVDFAKNAITILFGPNGSGKTSLVLAIHYSLCGMPSLRRQKRSGGSFFSNRSLGDRWVSMKAQFTKSWGSLRSVQVARMIRKKKPHRIDSLVPLTSDDADENVQANVWDPHNVIRTPENVDRFIARSLGIEPIELFELSQMQFLHEKPNYLLSRNYRKARRNLILWGSGLRALSRLYEETKSQLGRHRFRLEKVRKRRIEVQQFVNQAEMTRENAVLQNESNLRAILKELDNATRKDVVRALEQQFERLNTEERDLSSHLNCLEQIKSFLTIEMQQRAQKYIQEINQLYESSQLRIFDSKQALLKLGTLGSLIIPKRTKYDDFSRAEQKLLEILFRLSFMRMFYPDRGFLVLETPSEDLDQEYKLSLIQELARMSLEGYRIACSETNPKFVQALKRHCSATVLDLSEHAALSSTKLEQTSLDYFYDEI